MEALMTASEWMNWFLYERMDIWTRYMACIWIAFFFMYFIIWYYVRTNNNLEDKRIRGQPTGYTRTFLIGVALVIIHFFYLISPVSLEKVKVLANKMLGDGTAPWGVTALGFALLVSGFIIVFLGRIYLDGYWARYCCIYAQSHRKIVDSGIYNRIRHPIYLGQILMFFGTAFIADTYYFYIGAILLLLNNSNRGRKEDIFLYEEYEQLWIDYAKHTTAGVIFATTEKTIETVKKKKEAMKNMGTPSDSNSANANTNKTSVTIIGKDNTVHIAPVSQTLNSDDNTDASLLDSLLDKLEQIIDQEKICYLSNLRTELSSDKAIKPNRKRYWSNKLATGANSSTIVNLLLQIWQLVSQSTS
jgi:protein-S-isoprenylcysteine O-methyltransferase Ste14